MRRFVAACDAVGATAKKTAKVALVSELLSVLSREDAARAAIFMTGRPFSHRDERVLGVGGSQLAKIVAQIAGADASDLGKSYRAHGDLGDMAEHCCSNGQARPTFRCNRSLILSISFPTLERPRRKAR